MIYLNAGNLWDSEYLDTVIAWNEEFRDTVKVEALFGSVAGMTPTARSKDRLPARDWPFSKEYIKRAEDNGIAIRYTLNQSCIGSIQDFRAYWDEDLRRAVLKIHEAGVHEWTITSPLLVELLRELFPDDFIEVSTIVEVSTVEDTKRWLKLGADGVNISTSINRDFHAIERVVRTGMAVSILANEACLFGCPWRRECYNLSSHDSWRGGKFFDWYPFARCTAVRLEHPEEWVKSRLILPQWMKFYQEELAVNWFKIAFRTHPKEVALPMLRFYMEQDFHGSLLELWPTISHLGSTPEPKDRHFISVGILEANNLIDYFENWGHECAAKDCSTCGYCESIYKLASEGL